jgi:hypothetical protein
METTKTRKPQKPDFHYTSYVVDGGKTHSGGKAHWPSIMLLRMDRRQALDMAVSLLNQLNNDADRAEIEVSIPGKQETIDDE